MNDAPRKQLGLTLIEIMSVVVILGLLMGVMVVNVMDQLEWAKVETTRFKLKSLEQALDMHQMRTRRYPDTEAGLAVLLPGPNRTSGLVQDADALDDAWARPFEYESPGSRNRGFFDLWSWGRDGEGGGEGPDADITNWERAAPAGD